MYPDPVKIAANWTAIRSLAPDRFDAYARPGDSDGLDAAARYVWNMELCQALQTPLHVLEVTFRNQLHNVLSATKGRTDWFNDKNLLNVDEQRQLQTATDTLTRQKRAHDPGRIVAELNFGFWTTLYGRHHEYDIVRPSIRKTFPHLAAASAVRAKVACPLRDARLLRNRVSHHEHVCFDPALPARYAEIVQLIAWMSPEMASLASVADDFLKLYGATWTALRPVLEAVFG